MDDLEKNVIPIYSGKPEDFTWIGFGSGSGTNLRECAKVIKPRGIFCDRPSAALLSLDELKDVPKIVLNGYAECGKRPKLPAFEYDLKEYDSKCRKFNQKISDQLEGFEAYLGKPLDLIVLGGYMRILGEPLLERYQDRIINVHPADLTILTSSWSEMHRRYIGEDAVYDAMKDNEKETRSSVIIVDDGIDHGEILTMGPKVCVDYSMISRGEEDSLKCLSKAHQAEQKMISDGPALTTALRMIADGRIALGTQKSFHGEWRTVYVDGKPMGYGGYEVKG